MDDIKHSPHQPEEPPYIQVSYLDEIRKDVMRIKQYLREEVDRKGGISELARKTEIPQPSLSRFFSSTSMPQRTTLYKIAKALNLPESAIGFHWSI